MRLLALGMATMVTAVAVTQTAPAAAGVSSNKVLVIGTDGTNWKKTDRRIGRLLDARGTRARETWTVLVTTDHGQIDLLGPAFTAGRPSTSGPRSCSAAVPGCRPTRAPLLSGVRATVGGRARTVRAGAGGRAALNVVVRVPRRSKARRVTLRVIDATGWKTALARRAALSRVN